jgi:hypothetical protein
MMIQLQFHLLEHGSASNVRCKNHSSPMLLWVIRYRSGLTETSASASSGHRRIGKTMALAGQLLVDASAGMIMFLRSSGRHLCPKLTRSLKSSAPLSMPL